MATALSKPEVLFRAAILIMVSMVMGVIQDSMAYRSLLFEMMDGQIGAEQEGDKVTLVQAYQAFQQKEAVFIDARSPMTYAQGHIAGALNIPLDQFDERASGVLANLPKDTPLITYCSGVSCSSSLTLAQRLKEELGFQHTKAFWSGWPAWVDANYPTAVGEISL